MRLSLGAWWPEGRNSSAVFQSLPSCSWSACQMAVNRNDGYRGELSLWWFLQLCFCSVWGRWPAERGEQTLRCAQLSARLSVELCSPGLWHYYYNVKGIYYSHLLVDLDFIVSYVRIHQRAEFWVREALLLFQLFTACTQRNETVFLQDHGATQDNTGLQKLTLYCTKSSKHN